MRFRVADLIERAEAEKVARVENAAAAVAASAAEDAAELETWLAEKGPGFLEFATVIRARIRKGKGVTNADIPKSINHYGTLRLLPAPDQNKTMRLLRREVHVADLDRLIAALRTVADEEITTSGLQALGFRLGDFRAIFGLPRF